MDRRSSKSSSVDLNARTTRSCNIKCSVLSRFSNNSVLLLSHVFMFFSSFVGFFVISNIDSLLSKVESLSKRTCKLQELNMMIMQKSNMRLKKNIKSKKKKNCSWRWTNAGLGCSFPHRFVHLVIKNSKIKIQNELCCSLYKLRHVLCTNCNKSRLKRNKIKVLRKSDSKLRQKR